MDPDTDSLLYTATLLRGLAGPERNGELANQWRARPLAHRNPTPDKMPDDL